MWVLFPLARKLGQAFALVAAGGLWEPARFPGAEDSAH
jgi:hypothetical protein